MLKIAKIHFILAIIIFLVSTSNIFCAQKYISDKRVILLNPQNPLVDAETEYNIPGSLVIEKNTEDYNLLIVDDRDDGRTPPIIEIDANGNQSRQLVDLFEVDPVDFQGSIYPAYPFSLPRQVSGIYSFEVNDVDFIINESAATVEVIDQSFQSNVSVTPSLNLGYHLLLDESRIVNDVFAQQSEINSEFSVPVLLLYGDQPEDLLQEYRVIPPNNISIGWQESGRLRQEVTFIKEKGMSSTYPIWSEASLFGIYTLQMRSIRPSTGETVFFEEFKFENQIPDNDINAEIEIISPENNGLINIFNSDRIEIRGQIKPTVDDFESNLVTIRYSVSNIENGRAFERRVPNVDLRTPYNINNQTQLFGGVQTFQVRASIDDVELNPVFITVEGNSNRENEIRLINVSTIINDPENPNATINPYLYSLRSSVTIEDDSNILNAENFPVQIRVINESHPYDSGWINYDDDYLSDMFPTGCFVTHESYLFPGNNIIKLRVQLEDDSYYTTEDEYFVALANPPRNMSINANFQNAVIEESELIDEGFLRVQGTLSEEAFQSRAGGALFAQSTQINDSQDFLDLKALTGPYNIQNIETNYNNQGTIDWEVEVAIGKGQNLLRFWFVNEVDQTVPSAEALTTITVNSEIPDPNDMLVYTQFGDVWRSPSESEYSSQEMLIYPRPFPAKDRMGLPGIGNIRNDGADDFFFLYDSNSSEFIEEYRMRIFEFDPVTSDTIALFTNDVVGDLSNNILVNRDLDEKTFFGDLNEDSRMDVIQLSEDSISISYRRDRSTSTATFFTQFDTIQPNPLNWDPQNGSWIDLVDMTGDGRADLVQIAPDNEGIGTVTLMEFMGETFDDPVVIGKPHFRWDPDGGWNIVFGDFNGDGLTDIAQNTVHRDVWVALAQDETGTLGDPTRWAETGYRIQTQNDDPWWVYAMRTDDSGRHNLVCLNGIGEVWVAESVWDEETQEGSFKLPVNVGANGFLHQYNGPWKTFVGKFYAD